MHEVYVLSQDILYLIFFCLFYFLQKDDESDNEDVERVALVIQRGSAKHNSPDPTDEFFQMVL